LQQAQDNYLVNTSVRSATGKVLDADLLFAYLGAHVNNASLVQHFSHGAGQIASQQILAG
jgi:hypothetical protein